MNDKSHSFVHLTGKAQHFISSRIARGIFDALVVVGAPVLFLAFAPVQKFLPAGWVDPGIYLGFSMDYFDIVKSYGWNYQALRVSYILPDMLLKMALPAIVAQLCFVISFYLLGIASLYAGVRLFWGRMAAAVAVACLAYNPVYLVASTSGYVDAAFVSYSLAVFAVLSLWAVSQRFIWLVLAGMFATLALLAHVLAAAPIGLLLLFIVFIRWQAILARPVRFVGGGLLGIAATLLFFVLVLWDLNFGIDAFMSMSWIVNASISGIGVNYRVEVMDWLPYTTRLLPAFATAIVLVFLVSAGSGRDVRRIDVAAMLLCCASAAFLPLYDFVLGGSTTQWPFYTGLILPGICIGAGALAALLPPAGQSLRAGIVAVITVILMLATWLAPTLWTLAATSSLPVNLLTLAGVATAAGLILVTPLGRSHGVKAGMLVFLMALNALGLAINQDTRTLYRLPTSVNNAEYFRGAVFVRSLINADALGGREPLFWFHRTEFSTRDGRSAELVRTMRFADRTLALNFYDTLAALRLWHRALFMDELRPGLSIEATPALLSGNATLVVVEQDPARLRAATEAIDRAALNCAVRATHVYQSESFDMRITLIDVVKDGNGCRPEINGTGPASSDLTSE